MSTPSKTPISIRAQFLGPVFSLDAQLSTANQNLIFARNGTGKSFLSRAFRYLDLHGQQQDIADASTSLISDEAEDGKASFSVSSGSANLGELRLDRSTVTASLNETIFHVFSEDFVQDELRERQYAIDGQIENQIAVDRDDIKQKELSDQLTKLDEEVAIKTSELRTELEAEKSRQLIKRLSVNRALKEFTDLTEVRLIDQYSSRPDASDRTLTDIIKDFTTLKSLPLDPDYPSPITAVRYDDLGLDDLRPLLLKITSPSSVSEVIKKRIEENHTFYHDGTRLLRDRHSKECPFCDQPLSTEQSKRLIDAYVAYFNDEEEEHKSRLRESYRRIAQKEREIELCEKSVSNQVSKFNELKQYLPSTRFIELEEGKKPFDAIRSNLSDLKTLIERKVSTLATAVGLKTEPLEISVRALNTQIEANNANVSQIKSTIEKADSERKSIQRQACIAFEIEFVRANWRMFSQIAELKDQYKEKTEELADLAKLSPSLSARERVAEAFEILLNSFFSSKYKFDRTTFVLTRNGTEMKRGPHRTMSDGEKTAIAFCYFVACIHKKVTTNSDYNKLYLVFDDPVTSMSYDYIFSIAQVLKDLSISKTGSISINPKDKDNTALYDRPRILILTHSTYLFNICRTNRVVREEATFCLEVAGTKHRLAKQTVYVAPFERQLADIYRVANGGEPDHTTGNCVRSVLEAVGRFCRPDKTKDLGAFISFLAGECNLTIRSVLINSMSHGTYYEYTPTSDDVRTACKEAIEVVRKYAEGQVELISGEAKQH